VLKKALQEERNTKVEMEKALKEKSDHADMMMQQLADKVSKTLRFTLARKKDTSNSFKRK
jgi:hypothetical protein